MRVFIVFVVFFVAERGQEVVEYRSPLAGEDMPRKPLDAA